MENIYSTLRWRVTRRRAIERDGGRCTVSRLLGGACAPGSPHVHHIVPLDEGGAEYDLDNLGTACASHHPMWEALRAILVRKILGLDERPLRCPHRHRSREAREVCERRLARARSRETVAA